MLDDRFLKKTKQFKNPYLALPVTPKAHSVFFHVPEFIKHHGISLGLFSEQATEAIRSIFKDHWRRYKRNKSHPDYGSKLLQCIVDLNSKHL